MTLRTVRLRTAYRGPNDDHPAVANLDPVLLDDAVRAALSGVSGPLLQDAVARYGSEAEAAAGF